LNNELTQRWKEALRNETAYQQGKGVLRVDETHFCCLGVLCDIIDPDGWEILNGLWYHQGQLNQPTDEILNEAGLRTAEYERPFELPYDENDPWVNDLANKLVFSGYLARVNDSDHTFEDIIEVLDANEGAVV
jgi:hypothetical protein